MSAPNWLETAMVFNGRTTPVSFELLDEIVTMLGIEIVPFDSAQAHEARSAHGRYGRDKQHPARLNYGDCMAYALAKSINQPLLFKGQDFTHTDITPALA